MTQKEQTDVNIALGLRGILERVQMWTDASVRMPDGTKKYFGFDCMDEYLVYCQCPNGETVHLSTFADGKFTIENENIKVLAWMQIIKFRTKED